MLTEYEQALEAAFDAEAANPSGRFKVLSASEFCKDLGKADPYWAAVERKDWKTVNAKNDARAKALIKQWENELPVTETEAPSAAHPLDEPKFEAGQKQHYQKLGALLKTRSTVEWLIRDELEAGVIAVAAGPQGSYKSTWVNHVAMRVAVSGKPVFILSPEGSGLQRRLQGWLDEFEPMLDPEKLPLYVRDRRINLSVQEQINSLIVWLDEIEKTEGKPIALCCIDTWSKSTGHDEDSNTETKKLLAEIDTRIRNRKGHRATILIAAHTGKSKERGVRGASAFTNDTEAEYGVSFDSGVVQVTRQRFKDSPSLPPLMYKPTVTTLDYTDADGQPVTSVVLRQGGVRELKATAMKIKPSQKELLAVVLALGPKATLDKICDASGKRKNNAKIALDTLCDLGELGLEGTVYKVLTEQ